MLNTEAQQQVYENLDAATNPFLGTSTIGQSRQIESTNSKSFSAEAFNSPFAEALENSLSETETEAMFSEALFEFRDEGFDEAVANLADETEDVVSSRFSSEAPGNEIHQERLAEAHLAPIAFEAEQYLTNLQNGLAGQDLQSLSDEQLSETLDRFDPETSTLSIGGEQFIGGLIKKAKSVVNFVKKAAGTVGKALGGLLGPILEKLKKFVKPLLQRVLSFAIGKLPAPIQPAAKILAARIFGEASESSEQGGAASPANLTDVEALSESFDESLAGAVTGVFEGQYETETLENNETYETNEGGRELHQLAEARQVLIDKIANAKDNENLEPAFEQFVPAILGALRLGVNLIGRPKVVGFLAKYLAQLVGRFVGPTMAGPLSNAIVDVGMRLISLEAEQKEQGANEINRLAPIALAAVVEDTMRLFAENESYVLESQELMQLAASEAFSEAVATHFPQQFVRSDLQQSPSLGGTFVVRQPRSVRRYSKYNRLPEIEITPQVADAVPSFGGGTLGGTLRAAGVKFPFRARLHIYQAALGTSPAGVLRNDQKRLGRSRSFLITGNIQPLTSQAAAILLREPRFGVDVPGRYLKSHRRVAVGQRFYALEPIGHEAQGLFPTGVGAQDAIQRTSPSKSSISLNLRKASIKVSLYFSETEVQEIATAIRQARGPAALLQAVSKALKLMHVSPMRQLYGSREVMEQEQFSISAIRKFIPRSLVSMLRKKLSGWVMPALADWAKNSMETFMRAAAHPAAGVTVHIHLSQVPGLIQLAYGSLAGPLSPAALIARAAIGKAKPHISISVVSGKGR